MEEMMKKIEVGMLVEVVAAHSDYQCWIGHVGKVLAKCDVYPDSWDIDGIVIDGAQVCAGTESLRPIDDNEDASWERIEELTKWKPPVEVSCEGT